MSDVNDSLAVEDILLWERQSNCANGHTVLTFRSRGRCLRRRRRAGRPPPASRGAPTGTCSRPPRRQGAGTPAKNFLHSLKFKVLEIERSTCLDISAAPGDERSLRVETVEAQSQLELLVEEDEYLDALLLKEHK